MDYDFIKEALTSHMIRVMNESNLDLKTLSDTLVKYALAYSDVDALSNEPKTNPELIEMLNQGKDSFTNWGDE